MVRVVGSDSSYSNSSIAKRTGLTRRQVEELKSEGKRDISERDGIKGPKTPLGVGSVVVGQDRKGNRGVSISALGFGVEYNEGGGGSISFPGGIKVESSDQGCYVVQKHSIFGQEAFTNIRKKSSCDGDDDNGDEGGGGNQPKPPHCVDSQGNRGKGPAKNLYPECLRGTGIRVRFHVTLNSMSESTVIYTSGTNAGTTIRGESLLEVALQSIDLVVERRVTINYKRFSKTVTTKSNGETTERINVNQDEIWKLVPCTQVEGYRCYSGTLEQLESWLRVTHNRPSDENIVNTLTDRRTEESIKRWAVVWTDNLNFSSCNPTGNEGCGDSGGGSPDTGNRDKDRPFPGNTNRPQEGDNKRRRDSDEMSECCANTKKIAKVLAVDELLENGLIVPNRLFATHAKGSTKLENYLDIIATTIRIQDHLGVHPIEVRIQDANKSKEGDQTYEATHVNATAAIKQLLELGQENKGDSADRLGILVRTAWICVQILNTAVIATRAIQGVMQFLGMPIRERIEKVWMPFDLTLGSREKIKQKGFDPNKKSSTPTDKEIKEVMDLRDEDTLENILPRLLNSVEQPVKIEEYKDDSGVTLLDIMRNIRQR